MKNCHRASDAPTGERHSRCTVEFDGFAFLILMMIECARAVRNAHGQADSKPLRAESDAVEKRKSGVAARGGMKCNEACGAWQAAEQTDAAKGDRANFGRRGSVGVSLRPGVRRRRPGPSNFTAA